MHDLSVAIARAGSRRAGWSAQGALGAVATVRAQSHDHLRVDWDAGVPERWVRVLSSNSIWGMVSALVPLALINVDAEPRTLESLGIEVVRVRDWQEKAFSFSRDVARDTLGLDDWSAEISPEVFSALDLWYLTVT